MSQFTHFGLSHWLGLLFSFSLLFLGFKSQRWSKKNRVLVRRILAAILFSFFPIYQFYNLFVVGGWNLQGQLPLHLTNFILIWLILGLVFEKSKLFFDLAYFWGFSGGLGSILYPDISLDFPDVGYIFFWASHAPMLLGVAMIIFDTEFRLKYKDLWVAFGFLLVYILIMYPVNLALGSNYGYLVKKPESLNFLNFFGQNFQDSPNFLLPFSLMILIAFHLVFLIYTLILKSNKKVYD
jgi:hypothetical integral membrane protein (TIGR02206 family)